MSNGTMVYVGGLSYCVRERHIERFFQKIGRVKDITMKNGYAFVEFDDYRDADDAVYELNGLELNGNRVCVERARGTPKGSDVWRCSERRGDIPPRDDRIDRYGQPIRTNYRLIVENLSSGVSWQDLKDFMRQAGEVTYGNAHKQHKNEGVVEFASYSDLKSALKKLDNRKLNGRRIRLLEDLSSSRFRDGGRLSRSPLSSRSRSRSRSLSRRSVRSCSRSRSRSHSMSKSEFRSKSPYKSPAHSKSRSRSGSIDKKKSPSRSQSISNKSIKRDSRSPDEKSRSPSREKNGDASRQSGDD